MITTTTTDDAQVFDVETATLAKLSQARALCIEIIESHNMQNAWHLDTKALRQVQYQKLDIEDAARRRFRVRVWL